MSRLSLGPPFSCLAARFLVLPLDDTRLIPPALLPAFSDGQHLLSADSANSGPSNLMDDEKIERLRERFLECPVCMDKFQDPRLLPCHHTMCIECIQRLLASSGTGRTFRCPQCRRDVCLPRGGVTELPVNFYIRSLQEELGEVVTAHPCQICCLTSFPAQFRCIDCDKDICRFCIHKHRLVEHKESAEVSILRMEVAGLSSGKDLTTSRTCSVHTEEMVQLFCESCRQPICIRCSCGEHRKHHFLSLGEKLHGSREHLQQRLEELVQEHRGVRRWLRQLEALEVEIKDNGARTLDAVQQRAQELHAVLDRMTNSVMDKVRYQQQQQLTSVCASRGGLAKLEQRLDVGVSFLRGLQEGDVSLELLDAFKEFSISLADARLTATSNKVIPVCDQEFKSGRHIECGGCLLGTFGTLKTHFLYLNIGKPQSLPIFWKISRMFTLPYFFRCMVLFSLLYQIVCLLLNCYQTSGDQEISIETLAAVLFTFYLFLCACFAFRKSQSALSSL